MSVDTPTPDPQESTRPPPPPPAMLQPVSMQEAIFDLMNDPRREISEIESFVLSDLSCLGAVNAQDGFTPLHEAARRGDSRLIRFFVNNGADVEVRGHNGETPILVACERGSLYAVHTLVECGANAKVVDNNGKSAMHYSMQVGAIHIMHYLRKTQKIDFRGVDNEGNTPLHIAVYRRNIDAIKYLLKKKRVNRGAANNNGVTPLHLAVRHLNSEMVFLLMSTPNPRKLVLAQDKNGCTPLGLAELGPTTKYKVLGKKMETWSLSPAHMDMMPWMVWVIFAIIPGIALTLAPLFHSYFRQPFGFIFALMCAFLGFFLPLSRHRIPHVIGWQNPTMLGGLFLGVFATTLCYFIEIFPRLWPTNFVAFSVLTVNSFLGLFLVYKLKTIDPGHDAVGKIGSNGKPLSIIDVAKQNKVSTVDEKMKLDTHGSPDYYAFCTYCEIVIPDRTKHCKLCNACCNGFDHHCMWLTSCIGYNNHRLFVIFTLVLGIDNFMFLYQCFQLLSHVTMSSNIWTCLMESFYSEHWILILIICNTVAGVFSFLNLFGQISHISKMETTFFDVSGKAAYSMPRERKQLPLATRLHLIYLFFTDYKKWYNRPTLSSSTACYPKYTV